MPELLYKKCHGSSPAVVVHNKHCCSYFGTAAIKHGTRQQSSSIIGLQLQQPAVATGSYSKGLQLPSLPPLHGATSALNAGNAMWGGRGESWGSCRADVDRHHGLKAQRGTGTIATLLGRNRRGYGNSDRQHRHGGRRARASPPS